MNIRKLDVENKYFLAPMHHVNDRAFRDLCKNAGAGIVYSELTNPESKAPIDFNDKLGIQIACNRITGIKKFIKKHEKNAVVFDFNLGCPSPHAKQSRIGWFMHKDYKLIKEILNEIRKNTSKPVSIKIRKMSLAATKNLVKIAEKYCDLIAVHPRTCGQGYAGLPDIDYARKIKKMTKLPIIYSGNIDSKEKADELLKEFDYIMIGRAAIGNPSIFSKLTAKKSKEFGFNDYLKLAKKYKLDDNLPNMKFQAMNFTKNIEGAAKKRNKIASVKSVKELLDVING